MIRDGDAGTPAAEADAGGDRPGKPASLAAPSRTIRRIGNRASKPSSPWLAGSVSQPGGFWKTMAPEAASKRNGGLAARPFEPFRNALARHLSGTKPAQIYSRKGKYLRAILMTLRQKSPAMWRTSIRLLYRPKGTETAIPKMSGAPDRVARPVCVAREPRHKPDWPPLISSDFSAPPGGRNPLLRPVPPRSVETRSRTPPHNPLQSNDPPRAGWRNLMTRHTRSP